MRLELTDAPVASRVFFQITPRYKYRQDGDCIVYRDQILLFNEKNNVFVHISAQPIEDDQKSEFPLPYEKCGENSFQSPYRAKSPPRRRDPENYFPWYEANVA